MANIFKYLCSYIYIYMVFLCILSLFPYNICQKTCTKLKTGIHLIQLGSEGSLKFMENEISTVKQTKASHIASVLEERITNGEYEVGTSMPSQNVIANEFDASSRSVREALKILETKGLISIQQGKPATVASASSFQLIRSLSLSVLTKSQGDIGRVFTDLIKVLTNFSTSAVRLLASKRAENKANLNRMWEYQRAMDENIADMNKTCTIEVSLLEEIISGANNTILSSIFISLEDVMRTCLAQCPSSRISREKRSRDYSYLLNAIGDGQVDLAVAMMLMLLNTLQKEANLNFPTQNNNARVAMA